MLSSVLAGDTVDVNSLISPIVALGLGGVLFLMVSLQIVIVSKKSYDQMVARYADEGSSKELQIKDLTDANRSLRVLTEEQIIPALVRANQLAADYASDLAYERRKRRRDEEET